jgi:hypothetical protein
MPSVSPISQSRRANASGNGEFIVAMDDESRENEGDLMLPAQFATTEKFAFLVRHSRHSLKKPSLILVALSAYQQRVNGWMSCKFLSWYPRTLNLTELPLPFRSIMPMVSLFRSLYIAQYHFRDKYRYICPWSGPNSPKTCRSVRNRWSEIHSARSYFSLKISRRRCH